MEIITIDIGKGEYSMTLQTIEDMKQVDIRRVDKGKLVDLNSVHIDDTAPVAECIHDFLRQIQNPYCFRIDDIAAKVNYQKDGPSFQQNMEDILRTM